MKRVICILFFVLGFLSARAQSDTTLGPHKGKMHGVDNFKVEVLGCNDYLEVFIYDSNMVPIPNSSVVAEVKFFYPDEMYVTVPMNYFNQDGYAAKIPSIDFFYGRLTFDLRGKLLSFKFDNSCLATGIH